jgi:hypothetical protein
MPSLPLPLFAKCVLHACFSRFTHFSSMIMGTTHSTEALSDFAPAQPPQLHRISTVDRQQYRSTRFRPTCLLRALD